jgi:hypothetical protein
MKISQKTSRQVFHSNGISVLKKTFCWKINFIWKMTRIMLYTFVSKTILCFYQNTRWNQRRLAPKIYPKKSTFFLLKTTLPSVFSPIISNSHRSNKNIKFMTWQHIIRAQSSLTNCKLIANDNTYMVDQIVEYVFC